MLQIRGGLVNRDVGGFLISGWTAKEDLRFVKSLGVGWNLGNTLEPYDLHFETSDPAIYETYWNNPITTKEMLQDIKQAGFSVLRIPVTWQDHMDDNLQVNEAWMDRVQQVVDYGLEAGFYVIINAHHDQWYYPDEENLPRAEEMMQALWRQIAHRFESYDERLMFESMNEPRLIGTDKEWGSGTPAARDVVNKLNVAFVETVRSAGGENAKRYLLLPAYCARAETAAFEGFYLPKGSRMILSVHLYTPYRFAQSSSGTDVFTPESPADTEAIDQLFSDLKRLFIDKKIPVIITEFGAVDKDNEQQRIIWANYILKKAKKLGISCLWWDAGGDAGKEISYSLYDRYTRTWRFPKLVQALVNR